MNNFSNRAIDLNLLGVSNRHILMEEMKTNDRLSPLKIPAIRSKVYTTETNSALPRPEALLHRKKIVRSISTPTAIRWDFYFIVFMANANGAAIADHPLRGCLPIKPST